MITSKSSGGRRGAGNCDILLETVAELRNGIFIDVVQLRAADNGSARILHLCSRCLLDEEAIGAAGGAKGFITWQVVKL